LLETLEIRTLPTSGKVLGDVLAANLNPVVGAKRQVPEPLGTVRDLALTERLGGLLKLSQDDLLGVAQFHMPNEAVEKPLPILLQ
jgi:hypothetical protein